MNSGGEPPCPAAPAALAELASWLAGGLADWLRLGSPFLQTPTHRLLGLFHLFNSVVLIGLALICLLTHWPIGLWLYWLIGLIFAYC